MERRSFLRGLLGMSAAAVAAKLVLPSEAMAMEVQADIAKDLADFERRAPVSVIVPASGFDNRPVYASVSKLAEYWADDLLSQYQKDLAGQLAQRIDRQMMLAMTTKLARNLDTDLTEAKIIEAKDRLFIGKPLLRKAKYGGVEIAAGVAKKDTIFGTEYAVEYIKPAFTGLILT